MHVLTGSYISNLAYCEYKAVLSLSKPMPRIRSQARIVLRKVLARLGVEARFDALYGEVDGVPLAISPGAVLYNGESPYAILKPVIRDNLRVYEADFTPLKVAGLLLEMASEAGGDLTLAVVASTSEAGLERGIMEGIASGLRPVRGSQWVLSTRIYDGTEARRILGRAVEVARDPGLASPSPSPRKCSVCEFSKECAYALR